MKLSRPVQILLVVLLAVLTVVLVAYAVRSGGTSRPNSADVGKVDDPASASSSASVAPPVPTLLVIGDSAAAGSGASSKGTAWVGRVTNGTGWTVVNRSVQGAGYVARTSGVGSCDRPRCPSFATLLKRSAKVSPDVVLVAGGRDDALVTEGIDGAARSFFAAVRKAYPQATILALDPSYDTFLDGGSTTLTTDVRAAVTPVQGTYADIGRPLADHDERLAEDGTNPNDMGHRAIARAILAKLRTLPLT